MRELLGQEWTATCTEQEDGFSVADNVYYTSTR